MMRADELRGNCPREAGLPEALFGVKPKPETDKLGLRELSDGD